MDAIEHTASPFHYKVSGSDELIIPSPSAYSRVCSNLVTSFCVAVLKILDHPKVSDESNWGEQCIRNTSAEKAAWDFVAKNKSSMGWDLVNIGLKLSRPHLSRR
ncbi:hypothetical protein OE88DRAFT_1738350 [Heliocybe sulcata]|uniref:Uncharacterized protein n=1 Tax=Heliocybe sulcata TaxID=5364 RepID=A0A5C3MQY7_9AGAM|nr:hypothetical protein OE88DRAFT_1738350 [Heliocybe sulcata]